MARNSKYIDAVLTVLTELGGGPIPSKTLIDAIVEKGLLEPRTYLYHNVLRKVRESDLFDTSQRGFVSLAQNPDTSVAEDTEVAGKESLAVDKELTAEGAIPGATEVSESHV
jgi:hypothetical protein